MGYPLAAKDEKAPELDTKTVNLLAAFFGAGLITEEYQDFLQLLNTKPAAITGLMLQRTIFGNDESKALVWDDLNGVNRDRWKNGQTLLSQANTAFDRDVTQGFWTRALAWYGDVLAVGGAARLGAPSPYDTPSEHLVALDATKQAAEAIGFFFTRLLQVDGKGIKDWLLDPANAVSPERIAAFLDDFEAITAYVVDPSEKTGMGIVGRGATVLEASEFGWEEGEWIGDTGPNAPLSLRMLGAQWDVGAAKKAVEVLMARLKADESITNTQTRDDMQRGYDELLGALNVAEATIRPYIDDSAGNSAAALDHDEAKFSLDDGKTYTATALELGNSQMKVVRDLVGRVGALTINLDTELGAAAADVTDPTDAYPATLLPVPSNPGGVPLEGFLRTEIVDGVRVKRWHANSSDLINGDGTPIPDGYTNDPPVTHRRVFYDANGLEVEGERVLYEVPTGPSFVNPVYRQYDGQSVPSQSGNQHYYRVVEADGVSHWMTADVLSDAGFSLEEPTGYHLLPIDSKEEYYWDEEHNDIWLRTTPQFLRISDLTNEPVSEDRVTFANTATETRTGASTLQGKIAAEMRRDTISAAARAAMDAGELMRKLVGTAGMVAGWDLVPHAAKQEALKGWWNTNITTVLPDIPLEDQGWSEPIAALALELTMPDEPAAAVGVVPVVEEAAPITDPAYKTTFVGPSGVSWDPLDPEDVEQMSASEIAASQKLFDQLASKRGDAPATVPTGTVTNNVFKSGNEIKAGLAGRVGRNELTAAEAESIFGYVIDSLQEMATGPVTPEELAGYDEIMAGFAGLTVAEAQARANSIITTRRAVRQDTEQRAKDAFTKARSIETAKETRVEQERINRIGIRSGIATLQQRQQEAITGVQRAMATAQQAIASDYLAQAPGFGPTTPGAKIGGAPIYEQLAERAGLVSPGYLPFGAPVPEVPQASDIQAFQEALASARQKVQYQTEEELLAELPEYTPVPGVSG